MYILSTIEILHENPYTGDKITKARIVQIDPAIFPHNSDSTQGNVNTKADENLEFGQDRVDPTETDNKANETNTGGYRNEGTCRFPELIAIKYLSDYRTVRVRCDRDAGSVGGASSWSGSEDESDLSDDEIKKPLRHQAERPLIGETVPQGIRFGVRARREIRALKAAQGHPNVATNPFKPPKNSKDNSSRFVDPYQGGLLTEPAPLIQSEIQSERSAGNNRDDNLRVSLLGQPLGRSLFQEVGGPQLSKFLPPVPDTASELFPPFHNSGFNSDYDSDLSSEDDDDEDDYGGESGNGDSITRTWNRIFTCQPRKGGILLPYIPITIQDLIRIGWTKTRPVLVETCMRQILEGLAWIHDEAGLIHRDISAGNIMVNVDSKIFENSGVANQGELTEGNRKGIIQCVISDFGCATFYQPTTTKDNGSKEDLPDQTRSLEDDGVDPSQEFQRGLTFEVGTRAYRAPELLFSSGSYTSAIDIWSAGVLFGEMFLGKPLFEAESDIGQVCAIVKVLGTPTEHNWPEYTSMPDYGKLVFQALETNPLSSIFLSSQPPVDAHIDRDTDSDSLSGARPTLISPEAFELIERMITYSGAARPSAKEALEFKNRFLDGTKFLRTWRTPPPLDENAEINAGQQEHGQSQEFLQCVIDESIILEEMQKLRAQEADEDEYGGGFMFGGFGGSRRHQPEEQREGTYGSIDESEDEEDRGYRSDDFTSGGYGLELGNAYGFEEYDDENGNARSIE
ncbi:hypothetical protein BGZ80_008352 [Entomortierella chlamydospora]|uniref:Protein kinase domain-containing protein n=1 Tax=Entomortierella chlamydospora TaxID=101097 RepID=A0A9P6T440_9FUNG|nr:hypothetical protein BGZ80_008352 [Entomortierella chlamydospora]